MRCFEKTNERLIELLSSRRVYQVAQAQKIRLWVKGLISDQLSQNCQRARAAHSDDANSATAGGRGQSYDSIGLNNHKTDSGGTALSSLSWLRLLSRRLANVDRFLHRWIR